MSSKGSAIVTGAAQGIGEAIALRLANDGFDVAVNDIASKKEELDKLATAITQKGRRSIVVLADVSAEGEVKAMVETVVKEFGGLDVMVSNAGVTLMKDLLSTSVEDLDRLYSINVRGTFLCYKYAAIQMIAQGRGGRIIGATSATGKKGESMFSAYSASKFAIRSLTQTAALELGKHKIRVNAYAPGAIRTPLLGSLDDTMTKWGLPEGELYKLVAQKAALGYVGAPQDVANLVSFLASKESDFITGQSILCDGGIHFD